MQLDAGARAAGVRLIAHEALGSTNAEALALARRGEAGPLWITAQIQTAGRGRRGRRWVSQRGNLHATLLLTDPAPRRHWPELSLVAALALYDAVFELAPDLKSRLAIKWPNDLVLAGKKFAGILLEGESKPAAMAIGIGVNCASHPEQTDYPATGLRVEGAEVSPEALFGVLSAKTCARLAQWNGGRRFAAVRADWLARAAALGDEIRVRLTDRDVTGRFEGLDREGGLVLRRSGGAIETIAAGDVMMELDAVLEGES